ncbi:hypothetical protein [Parasitella parasitica]|uniref:Uncharacterized protein n=1 Tax=Parasitella parasitica TaxID=35722 RepID=A0A0B7MMQ5_9FUNG|nr:hypothetical protein [Parasitella parasitica]
MYYMLNYFNEETRHKVTGLASSSAFTFDNSTRAFCSTRINMDAIRPIAMVDENNRVIVTNAKKIKAKDFDNRKHKKLQYLMFKFVWEHIDNENIVDQRNLNKEAFVFGLINLHEELCDLGILPDAEMLCPVQVVEQIPIPKRSRNTRFRPQVNLAREIEYSWNPRSPKVNWGLDALRFEKIINDNIPFDASTIGEVEEEPQESFTASGRRRRGNDVTMSESSSNA